MGMSFNKYLAEAGAARKDCFIAFTVCCSDYKREDKRATVEEIQACRPRLLSEIVQSGAQAIIAMGSISQQLFFPGNTVSKIRGNTRAWQHPTTEKVYPVVSTYGVGMAYNSPQVGPLIVEDLKTALSYTKEV